MRAPPPTSKHPTPTNQHQPLHITTLNHLETEANMAKSECPNCSGGPFKGFCPFSLFLFTGTAISYVRYLQSKSKGPKDPFRVVFVLGGPGAGKVCALDLSINIMISFQLTITVSIFREHNVNSCPKILAGLISLPATSSEPNVKRLALS